jgi:hypothetical protein
VKKALLVGLILLAASVNAMAVMSEYSLSSGTEDTTTTLIYPTTTVPPEPILIQETTTTIIVRGPVDGITMTPPQDAQGQPITMQWNGQAWVPSPNQQQIAVTANVVPAPTGGASLSLFDQAGTALTGILKWLSSLI